MKMLLIDGVKYELWTPTSEAELEQIVIEHAQDIFGENSIYLDKKQKLRSLAGVGATPDALVIAFGNTPQWHIVELELSSHDPYQHVVPQVDRFIVAIDNPGTRNKIINALYDAVDNDELLKVKTRQVIGQGKDIHKFLADLITTPPTITIVIEKDTDQLEEALRKYAQKKVIEFQTFRKVEAEAVHIHLFEPLYQPIGGLDNQRIRETKQREWPRSKLVNRGLRLYVKDGKHYNPIEALEALGGIRSRMIEGRSYYRATMPDGTILEYIGSTKNGKSKIAKVHAYLLDHGFTFSQ